MSTVLIKTEIAVPGPLEHSTSPGHFRDNSFQFNGKWKLKRFQIFRFLLLQTYSLESRLSTPG